MFLEWYRVYILYPRFGPLIHMSYTGFDYIRPINCAKINVENSEKNPVERLIQSLKNVLFRMSSFENKDFFPILFEIN